MEVPTRSGQFVDLHEASKEIARRLVRVFEVNGVGLRPCHGDSGMYLRPEDSGACTLTWEPWIGAVLGQLEITVTVYATSRVMHAGKRTQEARTPTHPHTHVRRHRHASWRIDTRMLSTLRIGAVLRVLSPRDGPRTGRIAPDRLDCAHCPVH